MAWPRPLRALLCLLAAALALGCDRARPRAPAPGDPVVSVGHRTLTWGELRGRYARAHEGAAATHDALRRFLQEAVEQELALAEADALGIAVTDAELDAEMERLAGPAPKKDAFEAADRAAWREDLRRRLTADKVVAQEVRARVKLAPEEIERAYREALEAGRFRSPERVRARQVWTASAEAAAAALEKLRGGAKFEDVLGEFASPSEVARGGQMGWIDRGTLPESMDEALFALAPGERSDVVQSPYGFHVFEALERTEAGVAGLARAEPEIRRELISAAEDKLYREWIAGLAAEHPVVMGKDFS